jgi:uncharacterized DUF497 family protein
MWPFPVPNLGKAAIIRAFNSNCRSAYVLGCTAFNLATQFLDICIFYTYLPSVEAEWDPAKARSNLAKHGISFADADSIFDDQFAISLPSTSLEGEERFVAIGADSFGRILVVTYTYRRSRIRMISARRANRSERRQYAKGIRL